MGYIHARRLREFSRQTILIMVSLAMTGFIGVIQLVKAEPDTTPLQLQNIVMSSNTADVTNGTANITITADIVDDLSGYGQIDFYYTSPSGRIVYEGNPGVGDAEGFVFSGNIDFRHNTEAGVWKPTFTLRDAAGNRSVMDSAAFLLDGYSLDVTVISPNEDVTAPSISAITQDQSSITVDGSLPESVDTAITVSDNAGGQGEVYAHYTSPSGQKITIADGDLYDGTTGTFSGTGSWNPYSEGGTWGLYVTVCDVVRNCTSYEPSDLSNLALISGLDVTSTQSDTTPLSITNLDTLNGDPTFDLAFTGGAAISALIEFGDDLSGVADAMLTYTSSTSQQQSISFPLSIGTSTGLYYVNATLPPYAASGTWLPTLYTRDNAGNEKTYSHTDLVNLGFNVSFNFGTSVVETAAANETVTTDPNNDGASPTAPIQTSVTVPVSGAVSITSIDPSQSSGTVSGYVLVGTQVSVSAPVATEQEPITLNFTLDASQLSPGQDASNVAIFRNGLLVGECPGSTVAIPSPCVYSRTTLQNGDVAIGVRTAQASIWSLGFAEPSATLFQGFLKPTKSVPDMNKSEAGEVEAVKFGFGNNNDLSVLPTSGISSQQIDCDTKAVIGAATAANLNGKGLKLNDHRYKFEWKTLKNWKNTCRALQLSFTNGETATVYFKFKKD